MVLITLAVAALLVSLGSFGGYVTFGFDHPVVNVPGEYDLQICGNAFKSDSLAVSGGSSEPGVVMVGIDKDGDGVPDPDLDDKGQPKPLNGLATATYGMPNLDISRPTLGLSVDLWWEEGIWYDVEPL